MMMRRDKSTQNMRVGVAFPLPLSAGGRAGGLMEMVEYLVEGAGLAG